MIRHEEFPYKPDDSESEKASNSYLMSLIAIMVGMPIPIVNLLATWIFFMGNRKGTYFTRWHCTQALLSQITMFVVNAITVTWVLIIIFGDGELNNEFIAWLIIALLVNLVEFIMTIYSAIQTRRGRHIEWWFWGPLTHGFCKE